MANDGLIQPKLLEVLDATLGLSGRAASFSAQTPLIGVLPEFDSLGLAKLLPALEAQFKIRIEDDEVERDVFLTVGTLTAFVERKVAGLVPS